MLLTLYFSGDGLKFFLGGEHPFDLIQSARGRGIATRRGSGWINVFRIVLADSLFVVEGEEHITTKGPK